MSLPRSSLDNSEGLVLCWNVSMHDGRRMRFIYKVPGVCFVRLVNQLGYAAVGAVNRRWKKVGKVRNRRAFESLWWSNGSTGARPARFLACNEHTLLGKWKSCSTTVCVPFFLGSMDRSWSSLASSLWRLTLHVQGGVAMTDEFDLMEIHVKNLCQN